MPSAVPVVSMVSSLDAGRIINTWLHLVGTAESGEEEGNSRCELKGGYQSIGSGHHQTPPPCLTPPGDHYTMKINGGATVCNQSILVRAGRAGRGGDTSHKNWRSLDLMITQICHQHRHHHASPWPRGQPQIKSAFALLKVSHKLYLPSSRSDPEYETLHYAGELVWPA